MVKSLPAHAGDIRDTGSIPGLGKSPGGGRDNPLQYSCLENPQGQRSLASQVHSLRESVMIEVSKYAHNYLSEVFLTSYNICSMGEQIVFILLTAA